MRIDFYKYQQFIKIIIDYITFDILNFLNIRNLCSFNFDILLIPKFVIE